MVLSNPDPSTLNAHTADRPPSLGALLGETLRVAMASILLDLSQVRHNTNTTQYTPCVHPSVHPSIKGNKQPTLSHTYASTQLPFLSVTVSALAGRGRLPALQTASASGLQRFIQAWRAMWAQEGDLGFIAVRAYVPVTSHFFIRLPSLTCA